MKKNSNFTCSIYISTHKKFEPFIHDEIYKCIQNGSAIYPYLGYLRDDIGDNISTQKEMFNELTALYWIWKNDISDFVGLCHYRRYFMKEEYRSESEYAVDETFIKSILSTEKYDIILPFPYFHDGITNYKCYIDSNYEHDLKILRSCMVDLYPEFLNSYDYIWNRDYACMWNMFIMERNKLNEYCNWLFSILELFVQRVDTTGYNCSQIRLCGYIGERLLNVWVHHNKYKVKFLDIYQTDSKKRLIRKFIKRFLLRIPLVNRKIHNRFYYIEQL